MSSVSEDLLDAVAVIGLACRVPGAEDARAFWRNLCDGVESIVTFTDEELLAAGVPATWLADPTYVKAGAPLAGVELFDAPFFGFTPREAERTDPQHRLLLECAWEALEHAGYGRVPRHRLTGVFVGGGRNSYFEGQPAGVDAALGGSPDFLATRIAHKLDLRGPALTVQTACSTSLVAIHVAYKSLLDGECDLALAGGVSIRLPQCRGYGYLEGGILSPDGHCRSFDARAGGTVGANGLGLIVLRRLEDALADGDRVHAVLRGSAINNDGSDKVGFTAPSVSAQARVITDALLRAQVSADSIGYVEAHGTATLLGDPIEIAALTQAFRATTTRSGFCALGALKSNLGHLDAAAGVASFIKATLAVEHGMVPPSLHFERPNPRAELAGSPFFVATRLERWPLTDGPRRAGVSSFGMGGTNAHVVLEQAPPLAPTTPARGPYLLPLSARSPRALAAARARLAAHLRAHPEENLADVAFTLQVGRRTFDERQVLVCRDSHEALAGLAEEPRIGPCRATGAADSTPVVFVFPGQGAQHVQMASALYADEPRFRATVDECCESVRPLLGLDLRTLIWRSGGRVEQDAAERLNETAWSQPALFVIEYALARLWMACGVRPSALIGHSVGEWVAACLAGVFSLTDALRLVCARGALMQEQPAGAMLAVPLPEAELATLLGPDLALAAVNAPERCVVAGPPAAVAALACTLAERGVASRALRSTRAFHSPMMEAVRAAFGAHVAAVTRHAPRLPLVSNVTGDWLDAQSACAPEYWCRQLRTTVRFADGVRRLADHARSVFLEVGPGRTLNAVLRATTGSSAAAVVASLPSEREGAREREAWVGGLAGLWLAGVEIDWAGVHAGQRRRRLALPTYPFERRAYWHPAPVPVPDPPTAPQAPAPAAGEPEATLDASAIEEVVRGQLTLMGQQLELLRVSA